MGIGAIEHVDPDAVALVVFHSGKAPEVFSGDRAEVGAGAQSQPALRLVALTLVEGGIDLQPNMAAAARGGMHHNSGILTGDASRLVQRNIVEKDDGPGIAAGRAKIDISLFDAALCSKCT